MHRHIGAALFAAAVSAAGTACAEDSEIVVTATRSPTSVANLPARVEVIDRAAIEQRSLASLPDAIGTAAVQSGGAGQQASVFLRGANSNHVLALLDGVRLNDAASPAGGYDFGQDTLQGLDRIEILRGPASALYGSDAIGGVVNLIPRRGGASPFEPYIAASAGSLGTRMLDLGAAGGIGAFDYGMSVETLQTEGYDLVPARMTSGAGDLDGARMSTATLSARIAVGALSFDALARARSSAAEYDTFSGGPFLDLRADDPNLANDADQTVWRLGAETVVSRALTVRLSGGQVRADRTETDGGVTTTSTHARRDFVDATAHLEVGRFSATAGVSHERDAIDTAPQFALPLSVSEDRDAAFGVAQAQLTPALSATVSARIDRNERFGDEATYSGGVVYLVDPFRVYASAGTGFKAPSLSERFEQSFFNIGNPDLNAERSRSWEAGADWFLGDAAQIGVTYYQMRIRDLIEYQFSELRNVNVGAAEIEGAEIRAQAAPTSWATLRLAYAWTDARNGETGDRLLRRPEHAWSASVELRPTSRSSLVLAWSEVGVRRDVTYSDAGQFLSAYGVAPGWGIGSIAGAFDLTSEAQLFLRIDNITDEVYEQPAAFAGPPRAARIGLRAGL